jgi:hypothetical protein
MLPHPFTNSWINVVAGIFFILSAIALQGGLLVLYGNLPLLVALTDAGLFVGLLAVCGILSWFFLTFIQVWQAQIAITLLVQAICTGGCYMVVSFLAMEDIDLFGRMIPLRQMIGVLYWIVWMLSYHILQIKKEKQACEKEKEEPVAALSPERKSAECLDRISVKDGVRIHLIQIDELLYIQACGDYVTLFTHTGQYVKEQTMKYFDAHLSPAAFVRIHRSTIVNANHIMRVELFGKESYRVRLKNGDCLRASSAGYKLLKERLGL